MPYKHLKSCPLCGKSDLKRLDTHLTKVHLLQTPRARRQYLKKEKTQMQQPVKWWEVDSLIPFKPCSSMVISGGTGSGKTTWVYKLLQNLPRMYVGDPIVETMYCYGIHQPLYDEMQKTLDNFTLHPGLPTAVEIDEYTKDHQHKLIIIDDLMKQVIRNDEMELLFTQGCHHRRISVIFITQNLIPQGRNSRNIALNTWYLVLMHNMRDAMQIAYLGRQIFPAKQKYLEEAYHDAMKMPFGYLVVDTSPQAEEKYRVRRSIFPGEDPIVYLPKS